MTICICIECKREVNNKTKPVVLFATDTQESSPYLKRSVTKCRTIYGRKPKKFERPWEILISSAGDAFVADEVFDEIMLLLMEKIDPDYEKPSLALKLHRKEIGDIAYNTYKKYKDRNVSDPSFELILGVSDLFRTILHVTCEGKNQILKKFGIIGSGRITGGELFLNEFFRDDLNTTEAAHLASFTIKKVGHIDPYVGGEPDIRFCMDRNIWEFSKPREIISKSESRWELLKKAWWKMHENLILEEKIEKLMEKY